MQASQTQRGRPPEVDVLACNSKPRLRNFARLQAAAAAETAIKPAVLLLEQPLEPLNEHRHGPPDRALHGPRAKRRLPLAERDRG